MYICVFENVESDIHFLAPGFKWIVMTGKMVKIDRA